jgi:acetyl esterase
MSRPVLVWITDVLSPWREPGAEARLVDELAARSGWSVEPVAREEGEGSEIFPQPLSHAYRRLGESQARAGGAAPVAVGGCGGGAGIAVAVALLTQRYDEEPPAATVLLAPLLDARLASPSWRRFADAAERRRMEEALDAYAPGLDRSDPLLSPLLAERLEGLPPTAIATAAADPMRDDGERYAERLRAAGVTVVGHRYPGTDHDQACGGGTSAEGAAVVSGLAAALRLILSRSTQSGGTSSSYQADVPRPA